MCAAVLTPRGQFRCRLFLPARSATVYSYEDGALLICPECAQEWSLLQIEAEAQSAVLDVNGNALACGDTVSVIKDLKVKGSSLVVKVGSKLKNIRLVKGDHNIDCKIDGIGAMKLKSESVMRG